MLKNLLKPAGDPLEAMRVEHAAALAAFSLAEDRFGAAVLDASMAPHDTNAQKRRESAEAALSVARERLTSQAGALAAVEKTGAARAAQESQKAKERELASKWAIVETESKERERAAKAAEKAIADLSAAWRTIIKSTATMAGTGLTHDTDGSMLRPDLVDWAMRLGMAKIMRSAAGADDNIRFAWLVRGAGGDVIDHLPPLSQRIAAANAHLLSQKAGR
jgi:hypothetical protein